MWVEPPADAANDSGMNHLTSAALTYAEICVSPPSRPLHIFESSGACRLPETDSIAACLPASAGQHVAFQMRHSEHMPLTAESADDQHAL